MARVDSFSSAWRGNVVLARPGYPPHPGHYPGRPTLRPQDVKTLLRHLAARKMRRLLNDAAELYGDVLCVFYLFRDFGPQSDAAPTFPDDMRLGAINEVMLGLAVNVPPEDDMLARAMANAWADLNARGLSETMDRWVNYIFMFTMAGKHRNQHSALCGFMRQPHYNEPRAAGRYALAVVHAESQPLAERPRVHQCLRLLFKRYYGKSPTDCLEYLGFMRTVVPLYNRAVAEHRS